MVFGKNWTWTDVGTKGVEKTRVIIFQTSQVLESRRVTGSICVESVELATALRSRTSCTRAIEPKLNSCRDHRSSGVLERRMMQTSEMLHLQDLPEECCKIGQPSADGEQEEAKGRGASPEVPETLQQQQQQQQQQLTFPRLISAICMCVRVVCVCVCVFLLNFFRAT